MSQSEIDAAAERVRKYGNGTNRFPPYHKRDAAHSLQRDLRTLADAYLALGTDTNVLTLAKEVERLRRRLRSHVAHPSASGGFHSQKHLDDVLTVQDRERTARDIIDACRIHGVEVPEHLKPYEEERDMSQEVIDLKKLHSQLVDEGCRQDSFVALSAIERIKELERENAELYDLAAKLRLENYKLRTRLEGT